ncbi:MAG: YdgA family protein [Neisseria sp.]|nr:YdgA family protein [Neisseria sp.]
MKKWIALAAVLATALCAAMVPEIMGRRAQRALDSQYRLLQEGSLLEVQSRQYDRGWLQSTETLVVRLKPSLLNNAGQYLPDNLKAVLSEPVTVVNHVRHVVFADGGLAAEVSSDFRYSPEVQKSLKRFFGDQAPVEVKNLIGFSGAGRLQVSVPAFDYEELSGIALNWKGLSGTTEYAAGWSGFQSRYTAPLLHIRFADKADAVLEDWQVQSNTLEGRSGLSLGGSEMSLGRLSLKWQENIDYNIKLNELVNLMTDLQIGAFINPTGTIAPSSVVVEKLQFGTKMAEASEGLINSEGRFRFARLAYGEDVYGPLDIDVAAEHLDAKALLVLKRKVAEISGKDMSEDEIRETMLKTVRGEASGLFTNNPLIRLRAFDFTTPSGKIGLSGRVAFNNLSAADLDDIAPMAKKMQADFHVNVPEKLLESLAVSQANSLFSVNPEDEAEGRANIDDINETLRLMVQSTVNTMAQQGYLKLDNGMISTRLEVAQGELKLNGKVLETDAGEDDVFYEEEASGVAP